MKVHDFPKAWPFSMATCKRGNEMVVVSRSELQGQLGISGRFSRLGKQRKLRMSRDNETLLVRSVQHAAYFLAPPCTPQKSCQCGRRISSSLSMFELFPGWF